MCCSVGWYVLIGGICGLIGVDVVWVCEGWCWLCVMGWRVVVVCGVVWWGVVCGVCVVCVVWCVWCVWCVWGVWCVCGVCGVWCVWCVWFVCVCVCVVHPTFVRHLRTVLVFGCCVLSSSTYQPNAHR